MKSVRTMLVAAAALMLVSGIAGAAVTAQWQLNSTQTVSGNSYDVYDLKITTTSDWTNGYIDVTPAPGSSLLQVVAPSTNCALAQQGFWGIPVDPYQNLKWDTFVSVPSDGTTFVTPSMANPGVVEPGGTVTSPDQAQDLPTRFFVSWFDSVDNGALTTSKIVARVSVPHGTALIAPPTQAPALPVGFTGTNVPGNSAPFTYQVMMFEAGESGTAWGFTNAPEPATMALLAIGGVGMLLRRRR